MRRYIDGDKQKESNSGSAKEIHQLSKDGMEKKNNEIRCAQSIGNNSTWGGNELKNKIYIQGI